MNDDTHTRPITWHDVETECTRIIHRWREHVADGRVTAVYGVPRGGCAPAAIVAHGLHVPLLDADCIVRPPLYLNEIVQHMLVIDDLVDSGGTSRKYIEANVYFDALYRKPHSPDHAAADARELDGWLVFPWERHDDAGGPADAVTRLIEFIGEDPTREGLADTPRRVLAAWTEMTGGYGIDIEALLTKTFDHDGYDGMVIVRHVDFVSVCEHHMLPFTGQATVAYIPSGGRVVGLSKLARLVDAHAHRLQVQERMTHGIAEDVVRYLAPEGVGVVVRAHHECMSCRGVRKASAEMVTSSLRGALYDKPEARAEFMRLAGV